MSPLQHLGVLLCGVLPQRRQSTIRRFRVCDRAHGAGVLTGRRCVSCGVVALLAALVMSACGGGASNTASSTTSKTGSSTTSDQLVAYTDGPSGRRPELFVSKIDGTGKRLLVPRSAGLYPLSFAWSPNGRKIAFDSFGSIYFVNADGSGLRRLRGVPESLPSEDVLPERAENVAWAPDGTRLAFDNGCGTGDAEIYTVNVSGHGLRRLTKNATDDCDPAWSPDGRTIAYTSDRLPNQLFLMNTDGSAQRRLLDKDAWGTSDPLEQPGELEASWSPDGRRIVFNTSEGIYVVDADGSDLQSLAEPDNPFSDSLDQPTWSPDGQTIAYGEDRAGTYRIDLIDPDGSDRRTVDIHSIPEWQPETNRPLRHGARAASQ